LLALSETHRYRLETLRHLAVLQVNLQMRQNKTKDLREVIMNLAPAYEQWYAKTIAEGEQRGEARGEARGEFVRSTQIARRMLSRNIPLTEIAELTELTIEQLQILQSET
jgi:predicted transposase YdaD